MEIPAINQVKRPTISLALIAKNEEKNLPRLLKSVEGCFDEIVLVDTGSTDSTKLIAEQNGCKVYDFEWVNDFSAARNFAFSKTTKDYVFWIDCDDCLEGRDAFIEWRNHAMEFLDFAFATYHYALDKDLNPVVSFVRERVMKKSLNPQWQYPLHEGVVASPKWRQAYATTWSVKHMRDEQDMLADRNRNITILEKLVKEKPLDARMKFYYGKELYEARRPFEAIPVFEEVLKIEGLEPHDRLLAHQYGAYSSMGAFDSVKDDQATEKKRFFDKAIAFAMDGIKLDANRAEYHVLLGDAYLKIGDLRAAIPHLAAAKACSLQQGPFAGPIYNFKNCYGENPSIQLAKIYAHMGRLEEAKIEAKDCAEKYNNEEAKGLILELDKISQLVKLDNNQEECDDIVITTPPQNAYPFDEEIYKTKPLGGSETALVQMAKLLREKTGRPVKVFNQRESTLVADSGVEYIPTTKLNEYMSQHKPYKHIAWRHNIKITNAETYLWCHDLFTPGVETKQNFDKFLALSKFHRDYTRGLQGVSNEKIIVTRNGITPEKFEFERKGKDPNKIVWMSSPDRGLDRAIRIVDLLRKDFPDIRLEVYYGIEGLYKYGPVMSALADKLKQMMSERPWIVYHGFTEQSKMYRDVSDAVLWLHPCDFIETFCITALEMLALGIYPVTRRLGALANTLSDAESKGQATMLDHDCITDEEHQKYADAAKQALLEKRWERVSLDIKKHAWDRVADEWIEFMKIVPRRTLEVVAS